MRTRPGPPRRQSPRRGAATVRRRARQGPVTGPCRPARRSRPGRRIVVPEELPRKHHALDAAPVGEHRAEEVGRTRARRARPVAPEPDHAVADGARGEVPLGGERLEAGGGYHVRFAGDVVQPGAGDVDRHGAVAKPRPHPVDPLPARALAADCRRRCPLGRGLGLGGRGLWLRGVRGVRRGFFRRLQIGGGHGRPAIERQADPALRLLGDRAQLARPVAEVGGEGVERGGLLTEPAEPGLAGEPSEEQAAERARRSRAGRR